ncbi:MAG: hypothetical protein MJZ11_08220 [Lachnospiraceae bacterium]|nr:hypothetical protein [Lachnospiraceae bacterium]
MKKIHITERVGSLGLTGYTVYVGNQIYVFDKELVLRHVDFSRCNYHVASSTLDKVRNKLSEYVNKEK